MYLPLISEAGTKNIEDVSIFDDVADNFLLEIETALRMYRRKKIGILPLFVGTEATAAVDTSGDTGVHEDCLWIAATWFGS